MSCSRLSCHTDGTKDVDLRHSLAETVYLPVAELVRSWFGGAPTSGEREAIAAAARGLEVRGQVSSGLPRCSTRAGSGGNSGSSR